MPDEPTASEQPAATAPVGVGAEPGVESAQVDPFSSLSREDILRHPAVSGLIGEYAQRQAQRLREQDKQAERERADNEAQERLLKLAEEDPFAFSQKYLSDAAKEKAQLEIQSLRSNAQKALFEKIGASYGALPEWQSLTPEEFAKCQQAVIGVPDDEIVARFNVTALDIISDKRAASRVEGRFKERLDTEVEARLQERLAAMRRGEPSPDISQPTSGVGRFDPRNLSEQEFNRWYKDQFRI